MEREKHIQIFDKQAKLYEKKRNKKTEAKWRKKLFSSATGKTLEVSVGAGANFAFYPPSIQLTAVDFSPSMLEKAREAAKDYEFPTEFILSDIENLSFRDNTFDTIISSLSLCCYDRPSHVLGQFNKWCKEDGSILLLEHGSSSLGLLAWLQNKFDPLAMKIAGCHQNRDLYKMVEQSPLVIESHENVWLGAVYLIWAKPNKEHVSNSSMKWATYDPLGNVIFETTKDEFYKNIEYFRDIERAHYRKLVTEIDFNSLDTNVRSSLETTLDSLGIGH